MAPNVPRKTVLKMTKGHFQLIADVVTNLDLGNHYQDAVAPEDLRTRVAKAFADALGATNPAFRRDTFLKACGVE